ncbi:M48 family metallopeptidase [Pseudoxanthomonas putridarboris]|uniref:M48 family metallopeptidase n=1 Tax=Pseudoxanthomonas putridarboris TaxID=752605 RepID=A0ABU9IX84_9GAMM
MNFFEHQAAARRGSLRMVVLFALAVAGIVAVVDLVVLVLFGSQVWASGGGNGGVIALLAMATLGTLAVIGLGSLYRLASLRAGGETVALQMGGSEVPQDVTDLSLRRLRNVVEEIAIASGVPVPRVYVLENEAGINAFAAGYSPADAAVAVTRGALDRLNRDELQGVIAHEFSHILNGDMRLNLRLMGVLFGIMMLSIIGQRVLLYGRGGRGKDGAAVLMIALAAMVAGGVGLFFGRMIKAGVSRQRELLADASAVQFTRQTAGLAGALKKIGGLDAGSTLEDKGKVEEVSHMLFGEGRAYSRLFATHPPLLQRICTLDPLFGKQQLDDLARRWAVSPPDGLQEDVAKGLAGSEPPPLPLASASISLTPAMVAAQVATPADDDYGRAHVIATTLPDALRVLARQRDQVMPLLLGLVLDATETVAARQRFEIAARLGAATAERAVELREQHLRTLHPMLRLPLAALAFPLLRRFPRPELDAFIDTVDAAVHADGQVSLFEYCLARLLQVQVREALSPGRGKPFGRRKPHDVRQPFATLLAVVAQAGHDTPVKAQHAYLAGLQRVLPRDHLPYAPPARGVLALDEVWEPLDALDPLAKELMVEAVAAAVSHDGQVSVEEAELLRTVCAVLHCPLPAMLEGK